MSDFKRIINQWMNEHRAEGVEFLKKIIQAPSIQGYEKEAQFLIADKLKHIGLDVDIWEIDAESLKSHPYFFSSRESYQESFNVVGVLKGSGEGRSVILNGHIDVVPEGDRSQWEHDPFSGIIEDGKIYGRGATDMKGGNISLLLAIQSLKELGIELKGDVIFQSVIEEESGGAGTLAAILNGYKADAAIIPEPTSMKIFPKQQGSMWFRIFVKGQSAHGGTRYKGVSAIEKSYIVINHIQKLEEVRNNRITDPLFDKIPIPVPINIGIITGGNWPSSVADLVKIEGRIGVAPEEKMEDVRVELAEWLGKLGEIDPWFTSYPPVLEWFGASWVPGSIDLDHELLKILKDQYEDVVGDDPVIEASPWGTDGGLLTQVGGVPTIVFGPGVTEMAHYSNEYIEIDKVFQVAEIIALTLIKWCGVTSNL